MAFGRKKNEAKKVIIEKYKNEETEQEKKMLVNDSTTNGKEIKNEEIKANESEGRKISIKKGINIIANGRCFGSSKLECPLKTVRNYKAKILDIDKEHNTILIDNGWISIDNIK